MRLRLSILVVAVCMFGIALGARGDSISFDEMITAADAPYVVQFTLPKFDTNLGTLTGVTISLVENGTAEVDVLNLSSSAQNFRNASASIPLTVGGPDGTSTTATIVENVASGTANAGIFTVTKFPGTSQTSTSTVNVAAANFSDYESSGSALATFTAASLGGTFTGTASPGGIAFFGAGNVGGEAEITYTFISVPEPGSLGLAATAVVLVAGTRWCRRRRSATVALV